MPATCSPGSSPPCASAAEKGQARATYQLTSEPRRLPPPNGLCGLETGPETFQIVTNSDAQAAQLKRFVGKEVSVKVDEVACAAGPRADERSRGHQMECGDAALSCRRQRSSIPRDLTSWPTIAPSKPTRLTSVVHSIVKAGGSCDREAALVAVNLVEANLKGHDSHGVGMVPRYIEAMKEGGLKINQHVGVVMDGGVMLTLDGHVGYGQVMGYEAMELGAERAKSNGVCVVGLSNSHHIGRIGHWAEQCIAHGLVSIHFVNVLARPIVAPFGGRDARHGTNPFCVGIPRPGKDPIVLDFATSKIAQGKTRVAYNKGEQLAPNIILDDRGNPSTDPRYTVIEPFGRHPAVRRAQGIGAGLDLRTAGRRAVGRQDPERAGPTAAAR